MSDSLEYHHLFAIYTNVSENQLIFHRKRFWMQVYFFVVQEVLPTVSEELWEAKTADHCYEDLIMCNRS